MKKIIITFIMKEKKNGAERIGLLPNYIVKRKIVLQETGEMAVGLYCKMGRIGLELYCNTVIVLQLGSAGWQELYCNTMSCIVAGDMVACVTRQVAVSRYSKG